jgi:hypothetical protein
MDLYGQYLKGVNNRRELEKKEIIFKKSNGVPYTHHKTEISIFAVTVCLLTNGHKNNWMSVAFSLQLDLLCTQKYGTKTIHKEPVPQQNVWQIGSGSKKNIKNLKRI